MSRRSDLRMLVWKRFVTLASLLLLVSCGTAQQLLQGNAGSDLAGEQSAAVPLATAPPGQQQSAQGRAEAAQQRTASGGPDADADIPVMETPGRGRLFSKGEDNKPWPAAGTKEAKRQEELDARRERELGKTMMICKGC